MSLFKEFLNKLNEDEGGGADAADLSGDVSYSQDEIAVNDDDETSTNTSNNIAGWTPPIGWFSRVQMPQIYSYLYPQFVADLSIQNINHDTKKSKKKDLTPSQGEFKQEKVDNIKQSMADGSYKSFPLLVSSDNIIVDGHHRWHALEDNDYHDINQVDLTLDELYNFLQNKPYVFNRTKDE